MLLIDFTVKHKIIQYHAYIQTIDKYVGRILQVNPKKKKRKLYQQLRLPISLLN